MLNKDSKGPIIAAALASTYERRLLRLAFMAPEIQRDILAGRQHVHCNLEFLMHTEIPCPWPNQHASLCWNAESAAP